MTDVMPTAQRKENMRRIRNKDTKPEILLRSGLHSRGLRFRKNVKNLPGRPDIVLPKYRTVIFVNGCFWHRHAGCPRATMPKSNQEFWVDKFHKNVERDIKKRLELKNLHWTVMTIWECEINRDLNRVIKNLLKKFNPKDL